MVKHGNLEPEENVWSLEELKRSIETIELTMEKEKKEREKEFKKNFDMVDLVSPAWTIQVPVRKKK